MKEYAHKLQGKLRQQKEAFLTPTRKRVLAAVGKVAKYTVLGGSAAVGLLAASEYINHSMGKEGLAQLFGWRAGTVGNCTLYVYGASRPVYPNESAMIHIETKIGSQVVSNLEIDVSGNPLAVGGDVVCFKQEELKDAQIIFQAQNGQIMGREDIYLPSEP